jgi:TRAP-type mannitol/chloroaromatic compound transport system substrate-binding protein
MRRNGRLCVAMLAALAGCITGTVHYPATAQERVRWNLASSYGSQIDVLGKNILRVIDNIKIMSQVRHPIP